MKTLHNNPMAFLLLSIASDSTLYTVPKIRTFSLFLMDYCTHTHCVCSARSANLFMYTQSPIAPNPKRASARCAKQQAGCVLYNFCLPCLASAIRVLQAACCKDVLCNQLAFLTPINSASDNMLTFRKLLHSQSVLPVFAFSPFLFSLTIFQFSTFSCRI